MRGAVVAAALLLGFLAPARAGDPPVRKESSSAALRRDLREGDVVARRKAIYALFQSAPKAGEGLEDYARALRDSDEYVADVAGRILERWGPGAAAATGDIALGLRDDRPKLRAAAARILAALGESSQSCAPDLLDCLEDSEADVRMAAAKSLGTLGYFLAPVAFGQQAAAGLGQALSDPDPRVREAAAFALSSYGEAGRFALDGLVEALADGNARVRAYAINTLWMLGPIAEPALDRLYGLLADPDDMVRGRAHGAVAVIGPGDPRLDAAMRRGLKDGSGEIRMGSSWYLVNLPVLGPEEVALILALAADPAPSVRVNALRGLGRVRPCSKDVLAAIARSLEDGDAGTRNAAASAAGDQGEGAAHLVPLLIAMLRDTEDFNDRAACTALGRIGPAAAEAIPDLRRRWLRRKDAAERANAGTALARVSGADRPAVLAVFLRSLDKDGGELPRKEAAYGIGEMGAVGAEGIPLLRSLLGSREPGFPMNAVFALGRLGPAAEAAIPDLEALREGADERLKTRIGEALGRIRGKP